MHEPKEDYSKIARQIASSEKRGRDSHFYMKVFNYNKESFENKVILDVGPGSSQFNKTVEENGGQLIRIDPLYYQKPPDDKNNAFVGIAEALPFSDDKFDEAIASYSVFYSKETSEKALREMIRVTKKGGQIKIFPVFGKKGEAKFEPFDSSIVKINYIGHMQFEVGYMTLELKKPENNEDSNKAVEWCMDNLYLYDPSEYDPIIGQSKMPWEKWGWER